MNFPKEIFRAYDIRGIYPEQIDEEFVTFLGKAFGTYMHDKGLKTVVLGRDDRVSSLSLINSLADGLISTGASVINTGITVQPAMHYFTFLSDIDCGINVTASHNPRKFNGIKIDLKGAVPFFDKDLVELHKNMNEAQFILGNGSYKEDDLNPKYIDFISSKFKLSRPIKVVVYCGNGATSNIYPEVLKRIGADVVPLRCYHDSDFPVGMPDPESDKFYPELRSQVLESAADIGVGFDGDGDRVGEVDAKGNHYRADEIFLVYVKDVLSRNPKGTVIFDVKCSQAVPDYIKSIGGNAVMLKTGRAYFLKEMYEGNALLGCELSGHTYFKDEFYGFDDGIYATCRLLKVMDQQKKSLIELMSEFPRKVSTPELKYSVEDEFKFGVIDNIKAKVINDKRYLEVITIDGVRVKVSKSGWFLIRASNTSPYLSVRVEGADKKEVDAILKEVSSLIVQNVT